jgi:hypothetical protein
MTDMFGPDDPEEPPDYWEGRWQDTSEPEWWNADVTLYNDFLEPMTYTAEDWFNETLNSKEELLELYGLDNIDIIEQLEQMGLWDAEDWDYWREMYGEQ